MHFGKKLLEQRYRPWESHYLDYNQLKDVLERGGCDHDDKKDDEESSNTFISKADITPTTLDFASRFDEQVESVVFFVLHQQGLIASQLARLRQEQRQLLASHNGGPSSVTFLDEGFYETAVDLLHLVRFVDLNVLAIRKILKKHDKITGGKLSSLYLGHHRSGGQRPVVLHPLFEHGGLEALSKSLEDAFFQMYSSQQNMSMQKTLFRSNTTPEDADTRHGALQSLATAATKEQQQSSPRQSSDDSMLNTSSHHPRDAILLEIEAARQQLEQTRDFVHMLAAQMLIETAAAAPNNGSAAVMPDEQRHIHKKRRISNFLNLMSTFLHLTDYYIVGKYSARCC